MILVLQFTALIFILLMIFCAFGITLLPECLKTDENRNALFLISPLIGFSVWLALTVFAGMIIPYGAVFLTGAIMCAVGWAAVRRGTLYLPDGAAVYVILGLIFLVAVCVGRLVYPFEFDGGLYFSSSVYDHVRCAIVDSIARFGLFPVSPWLADNGVPTTLAYYFGWYAAAAQLPILTGISPHFAECAMTGFSFAAAVLGLTGFAWLSGLNREKVGIFFFMLLCIFCFETYEIANRFVPADWLKVIVPEFPGFWCILNNFIWSPHHMFSGSVVVLVIYLYAALLRCETRRALLSVSVLIGLLSAAAFLTSVYAGMCALALFAAVLFPAYVFSAGFRKDFNRTLIWQILAAALCLLLTALFIRYLAAFSGEEAPLAFGIMPCYGKINSLAQAVGSFLSLYCWVLPNRLGVAYPLGVIALLIPGILPKNLLMMLLRLFTAASLLIVFFVHSTFYSNDFAWRVVSAANYLLALFGAFTLLKLYEFCMKSADPIKRRLWYVPVILIILSIPFTSTELWKAVGWQKRDPIQHQAFARAVPGWDVVRQYTGKYDMVLCNPNGFDVVRVFGYTTNVFFSLFAGRSTPIGDLIFSKCYSEFYSGDKLQRRYDKVVRIFQGSPSSADIDYLADDLKVKALLITPLDGLWKAPGALSDRYPVVIDSPGYRVYLMK